MDRAVVNELLEALKAVEGALAMGFPPQSILRPDSVIRQSIQTAIAAAERELNKPIDMGR